MYKALIQNCGTEDNPLRIIESVFIAKSKRNTARTGYFIDKFLKPVLPDSDCSLNE